ncbi:MAG: hypothetical protein LBS68_01205 [Puniceicoccales bacterium]|jgi:hypothetical protein|nr:hypothetical protein [Puniceicoccales bacterium]
MAWIRLTVNDLQVQLLAAQLLVLRSAACGSGVADPLPPLLQMVVDQVRSAVANGGTSFPSCDPEKIPSELRGEACALVLEALQARIPALKLSADQVRAAQNAREKLLRVERGELRVSGPSDPAYHLVSGRSTFLCLQRRLLRVNGKVLGGL